MDRKDLQKLNFLHTHDILIDASGEPYFKEVKKMGDSSAIYVWLTQADAVDDLTLLYCGKAGYGPSRRMIQHAGGFKNSITGKENRRLILELLKSNKSIQVYARQSKTIELFGAVVSLYSAEEEAMCEAYSPLWNRAKFPASQLKSKKASKDTIVDQYLNNINLFNGFALKDHIDSLEKDDKAKFVNLLMLLDEAVNNTEIEQKIIRGYSQQPKGYSRIPMLVYCKRSKSGKALSKGWYFRVPLVLTESQPMTVFINKQALNADCSEELLYSYDNFYIPKDFDHFLSDAHHYIKKSL
jgi:hypothetical protein